MIRWSPLALLALVPLALGAPPPHSGERARLLVEARDGVIQGDLDTARTAGKALAWDLAKGQARDHKAAGPAREAAVVLGDAPNLDAAGRAVGEVAVACAECHNGRSGGPEVPEIAPLPEGDALRAEMERHAAALDVLWAGVLAPSQDALVQAAELFEASTLAPPGPLREHARAADERVTKATKELARLPAGPLRAQAFADVLLACAACHLARPDGVSIEPE